MLENLLANHCCCAENIVIDSPCVRIQIDADNSEPERNECHKETREQCQLNSHNGSGLREHIEFHIERSQRTRASTISKFTQTHTSPTTECAKHK